MKNVFQGEIWWINPTPKTGSEQKGKRPALIIQNDVANKYLKTTIIAMISSSGKFNMPEMVSLGVHDNLHPNSYADFAQIFTIDKQRLLKKIGKIQSNKWNEVEEALATIFYKTL
jgi:mRNA interferase MazF